MTLLFSTRQRLIKEFDIQGVVHSNVFQVWGFSGTDEQKELQKKQLRNVLTRLGADVKMDDVDLDGEKAFAITIEA